MRYIKGAWDVRRKKAVISAAFLSGISLLLSKAVVLPAYATEEIHEPAETEEDGNKSGAQENAGEEEGGESTEDGSAEGSEDTAGEQESDGPGGAE